MNKAQGRRQAHHKTTHRYEKQKIRTAINKAKHIAKAKALATKGTNEIVF